jgi:hypothetical protein
VPAQWPVLLNSCVTADIATAKLASPLSLCFVQRRTFYNFSRCILVEMPEKTVVFLRLVQKNVTNAVFAY